MEKNRWNEIIYEAINKGTLNSSIITVAGKASKSAIEALLKLCIERGEKDYMLETVSLLNRKLTQGEIDDFIINSINNKIKNKQCIYLDDYLKISALGASKKSLEFLISIAVKEGNAENAIKVAKMAKRNLSETEIDNLVGWNGIYDLDHAIKTAALFGRKLKKEELEKSIKTHCKEISDFKELLKATAMLGRKPTYSEVELFINNRA